MNEDVFDFCNCASVKTISVWDIFIAIDLSLHYTGSQRIITCVDKYKVVNNVRSTYWRHLARHMNLSEVQIDRIDYDYEKHGLYEKVRFLILWNA